MFQEKFSEHLSQFHTAPILFIGSGMSRRYIGLETWKALLEAMHGRLQLEKPWGYYVTRSSDGHSPDLTYLASLMGSEFNETWWTSDRFRESRLEYETKAKNSHSSLKYEISKYILSKGTNILENVDNEIQLLKRCCVDGIITTNWDLLLENIFPDYTRFVGQEELIFSEVLSVGEIYKIHGSADSPESLLLTQEDYTAFHERNPYLASKLLNIFMEHPIVFMGYSLDDSNVQQILKSIIKILTRTNIDKLKDRLIFCDWSPVETETAFTDSTLLIGETVLPIKLIKLNNYTDVLQVIGGVKRKIPVKLLRHMKDMVYDFVRTSDVKSNFYVAGDLDKLQDLEKGEFVYGVGLKEQLHAKGIKGLDTKDIIRDSIIDANLPSVEVCKLILSQAHGKYLPFFKHLSKGGFLDQNGELKNNGIEEFSSDFIDKVNRISLATFAPPGSYGAKRKEINKKYNSISELRSEEKDLFRQLMLIPLLEPKKIDLDQLRSFLKANIDSLVSSYLGTHFRKLVCLYDYLKYKYPLVSKSSNKK